MALDVNAILGAVSRMFPSANLSGVMQRAQNAIQGTPDTLEGAAQAAQRLGLNPQIVNDIFNRYGNTMQAQAICRMMGTTPAALKADADKLFQQHTASTTPSAAQPMTRQSTTKFPRLK